LPRALLFLFLYGAAAAPLVAQSAEGMPCREDDDPPAAFEYREVQVTIDQSCWKRQIDGDCRELIKGWSTKWIAAEARKAIDRFSDDACLGSGIQTAARQRMQKLRVLCKPISTWCGQAVPNSQTLTLGTIVADKNRCMGVTMTHEMLHAHAGQLHATQCAVDVTYSCDQSCFKKNTCQECAGGVCTLNNEAVHADLCKSR
jgi:hypothetical protein